MPWKILHYWKIMSDITDLASPKNNKLVLKFHASLKDLAKTVFVSKKQVVIIVKQVILRNILRSIYLIFLLAAQRAPSNRGRKDGQGIKMAPRTVSDGQKHPAEELAEGGIPRTIDNQPEEIWTMLNAYPVPPCNLDTLFPGTPAELINKCKYALF